MPRRHSALSGSVRGGAAALLLTSAALFAPCVSAEWTAQAPGGLEMVVVEDPSGVEGQYRLERRQGAQGLDRSFGQQGAVRFSFGDGTAVPSGVRAGPQGQIVVFGFTEPPTGRHAALTLRLDAQGVPDPRWGPGGLSRVAAAAADLVPTDALIGADGLTWMVGTMTGSSGDQAVVWRLGPDGRLDSRLGSGGFLQVSSPAPAQGLSLAQEGEGWLVGLLQGGPGSHRLQVWRWNPDSTDPPRMLVEQALPERWAEVASLEQRQGRWGWRAGADTPGRPWVPWPAQAAAAPAALSAPPPAGGPSSNAQGGTAFNPYAGGAREPASTPPTQAPEGLSWVWWTVSLLVIAVGGWWAWRRR